MKTIMLGVGDYGVSNTPGEVIKTLALGSCVAMIVVHLPTTAVGMVHVALPESNAHPERAKERPGYFADTGVPALLSTMLKFTGNEKRNGVVIKLVGGAQIMDPNRLFNIGERNVLAIKKMLWQFGTGPIAEDIGGRFSRSVAVYVDSGKIIISSPGRDNWEI